MTGAPPWPWAAPPESGGFGVYVHVPFCTRRCDYCAFATWTDRFSLAGDYVNACVAEVRSARSAGAMPPATSVFFGGGTPSLLEPDAIGSLLSEIELETGAEVTVECNPDTVDEAKLRGYRSVGVNRLSFGVQSLRVLKKTQRSLSRARTVDTMARLGEILSTLGSTESAIHISARTMARNVPGTR